MAPYHLSLHSLLREFAFDVSPLSLTWPGRLQLWLSEATFWVLLLAAAREGRSLAGERGTLPHLCHPTPFSQPWKQDLSISCCGRWCLSPFLQDKNSRAVSCWQQVNFSLITRNVSEPSFQWFSCVFLMTSSQGGQVWWLFSDAPVCCPAEGAEGAEGALSIHCLWPLHICRSHQKGFPTPSSSWSASPQSHEWVSAS